MTSTGVERNLPVLRPATPAVATPVQSLIAARRSLGGTVPGCRGWDPASGRPAATVPRSDVRQYSPGLSGISVADEEEVRGLTSSVAHCQGTASIEARGQESARMDLGTLGAGQAGPGCSAEPR